jgi:hypothetical protein
VPRRPRSAFPDRPTGALSGFLKAIPHEKGDVDNYRLHNGHISFFFCISTRRHL